MCGRLESSDSVLVPPSRLASTNSFGISTTTSTVLRTTKGDVPGFTLDCMGLWGMQDVRLAILPVTRAGSSPALPVVCNMHGRDDGRKDHGRVVRTSGRRGICRRDHARRRSPAHSESRDYVLRAALLRAPGRRPRSSGQKMDLWSWLRAR